MDTEDVNPMSQDQIDNIANTSKLYSKNQISGLDSESDIVEHLYDAFKSFFCIQYAIVNSWAMAAVPEGGSSNIVQVGGTPNIWMVTSCPIWAKLINIM